MKYEKIMTAFAEAKEDGIHPREAYVAYSAIEDYGIEKKDAEPFVAFVYRAWMKDELDLSIDTLIRKASEICEEKGVPFLLEMGARQFLREYCYE